MIMRLIPSVLAACAAAFATQRPEPADLILTNANVVTVDAARPRAEALAIRGDRIAAVGSPDAVAPFKGVRTRVIDLQGRTVVPGLVDGHLHFAGLAERGQLDLSETKSEAEAAALVRRASERAKPGEWIVGGDWHTGNWGGEAWPSRQTLDEALRSYTLDAAYASFQEDVLGSVTPGKLADLAVLSKDIMTIPAPDILATEAVMTIVGGRVVFERRLVSTGYARPELLVETDWLAAHLTDPGVRVVDMRPRLPRGTGAPGGSYDEGHIPGAVHLENRATRDPQNTPTFVPRQEDFERAMAAIGVSNGTRVVVYDERGGIYAARLWWLLNYYGHPNVALLNGGWVKWAKEERATSREEPSPPRGVFAARETPSWLATAGDVQDAIGKAGVRIVDARTTAEIEGRDLRGIRRGGFIPSSIPVYWEDALEPATKAFRPAADLARLYRDRGILPQHDVITYCQVGMRASHDLFVLRLLGYDKLRMYLGSWEEWGNRDDLPIDQVRSGSSGFDQVREGSVALVNARLIDGTGAAPVERSVVIVEDGRIAAVGRADLVRLPKTVQLIDVTGRTIVPGFINAHGHVGETRGLKSGADFYTEENVRAQLGLYARYGVTTVVSLGGDRDAGFKLRDAQRAGRSDAARLLVAGPVIAARTPEEARAEVDRVAALKPDWIKIRVDDNLGTTAKMPEPAYRAAIEQAHARGLRVAAHMFYLDDAKGLLRAGVDVLAHSVRDKPVDDELIDLLKTRGVCVCPTLMREVSTFVYGETPDFFADPFFLGDADRAVLDELRDPARQAAVRESRAAREYRKALDLAAANLKRLVDAGVGVAFGTDSGPPARFQGYFEHMELDLMVKKAGLTPAQAIAAATGGTARCLRLDEVGVIKPGAAADFIILGANPLDDIRNSRTIESVWIGGRRVRPGP